jgi:molecular chaperone GrpE
MSDFAPPGAPQEPAVAGPQADLTAAGLESALADFRRWFEGAVAAGGAPPAAPGGSIDLATLLGHYVALRQEVNLQTRAVRAQQEQNGELLARLGQAVEQLSRQQARAEQSERQAQEEKLRPLVSTLLEVRDALSLASRETQRAREQVLPLLEELAEEERRDERPAPARSFWSRWVLSPAADAALKASREEGRERRARETAGRARSALSALVTGYAMSLERVERALRKHGLEPIEAAGGPFDPEEMEVLEAVPGSGRPAGEVLEEVRRGYRWNGRVFRFAQVRVARD